MKVTFFIMALVKVSTYFGSVKRPYFGVGPFKPFPNSPKSTP